jgi:hypothetical protein
VDAWQHTKGFATVFAAFVQTTSLPGSTAELLLLSIYQATHIAQVLEGH